MDVCPRISMLCCPVKVEALRRADPRSPTICQNRLGNQKNKKTRRSKNWTVEANEEEEEEEEDLT
jgi:hypothetical protein